MPCPSLGEAPRCLLPSNQPTKLDLGFFFLAVMISSCLCSDPDCPPFPRKTNFMPQMKWSVGFTLSSQKYNLCSASPHTESVAHPFLVFDLLSALWLFPLFFSDGSRQCK